MADHENAVQKRELKNLIRQAASGDDASARRLVSPFINPDETLRHYGVSGKFGIIPTYDFLFLTDRRIGDIEITPMNGNLNVEVAYIQKIDAFVLSQPAFPLLLKLFMLMLYPLAAITAFGPATAIAGDLLVSLVIGVPAAALAVLLVFFAINPAIKRLFLRLKKSGLWCKLNGHPVGVYIFSDRDKFGLLTEITRELTEVKRQLDKVAT